MIDILKKAALAAGKVQLHYFKKGISVSYKTSHHDLVTKADIESQSVIKDTILKEMIKKGFKENEIGFIGEEKMDIKGKHTFVIDPIDGTTNFASGIDLFAVSIAYFKEQKLMAGLVYQPVHNIIYFANKGKGAFKGKHKLSVIYRNLKESLASVYLSSYKEERIKDIKIITRVCPLLRGVRILGCYVIDSALLAENRLQLKFQSRANLWDMAAVKLLLEEAGATVTDYSGKPVVFELNAPDKIYQTISCHPKLLNEILKYFDY